MPPRYKNITYRRTTTSTMILLLMSADDQEAPLLTREQFKTLFGFAPHKDIDRQHLRFGAPEDVNCGAKLLAQTVVSYADSPDGPWTPANKVIIPNGAEGEWDQNTVHDPYPLVHSGKIYLYYKADFGRFRDQPRKKI